MSGDRITTTGPMMVVRLRMMNGVIIRMAEEMMPRILEGSRIIKVGVGRKTTTMTTTRDKTTREIGAARISSRTTTMGIHGRLTAEITTTTITMVGRKTTLEATGVPEMGQITTTVLIMIREGTRNGRHQMRRRRRVRQHQPLEAVGERWPRLIRHSDSDTKLMIEGKIIGLASDVVVLFPAGVRAVRLTGASDD
jgi:hypothetical protein